MDHVVLSHFQCRPLLVAREGRQREATISLDLGLTQRSVAITPPGVELPAGDLLSWETITEISEAENACFAYRQGRLKKIRAFSDSLNRVYTLYPTERAPTMLVSGIPMHRIKGVDPYQDTLNKIRAIGSVRGSVLDTATGLGYTATEAARTASSVTTIELDPTVLEICRQNPWSQALFDLPNIEQRIGDAFELVQEAPDQEFSTIIHDPPTFNLAGHLYSAEFYGQLHRIVKRNGRLFHYVGDPSSRSGHNVTRGVVNRLREAGFRRVAARRRAFGVVAFP